MLLYHSIKTNEENARRAVGSVAGDGTTEKDAFLEGFLGAKY
jgi:hypothetical protein